MPYALVYVLTLGLGDGEGVGETLGAGEGDELTVVLTVAASWEQCVRR